MLLSEISTKLGARLLGSDDPEISGVNTIQDAGDDGPLAVGEGRVVAMFADGDADLLAAFDPESGDELWRYRIADTYRGHDGSHDGPISTPLMAGDRVYGLGPRGHLFAVDADAITRDSLRILDGAAELCGHLERVRASADRA